MARDDYFVIVYRILKYLYVCFKDGERADIEVYGPKMLGINNGFWNNVIESMHDEGHIKGVSFVDNSYGLSSRVENIKITQKGIEFLNENSNMKKAEKTLKSVKELIPFI